MSIRVAVVCFPGTNCDTETLAALAAVGAEPIRLDYRATDLAGSDAVILPGGFSYGDYLRSGAIARFAPIMAAVNEHARAGGAVLGICNGFQILCEAHLLPGALLPNDSHRFVARPIDVRIERTTTVCTGTFAPGTVVRIPQAHGDGRYLADEATLDALEAEGRVVLRYVASDDSDLPANPNGSARDIAGICNPAGNVVGFMPHPERLADRRVGDDVGRGFFTSLIAALSGGVAA